MMCVDCHTRPIFCRGRCRTCYPRAARRREIRVVHHGGLAHCQAPGCDRSEVLSRGLCVMHYLRVYRHGSTADRWPSRCACGRGGKIVRGMCVACYHRARRASRAGAR